MLVNSNFCLDLRNRVVIAMLTVAVIVIAVLTLQQDIGRVSITIIVYGLAFRFNGEPSKCLMKR